jgi:hypothetical protein
MDEKNGDMSRWTDWLAIEKSKYNRSEYEYHCFCNWVAYIIAQPPEVGDLPPPLIEVGFWNR